MRKLTEVNIQPAKGDLRHGAWVDYLRVIRARVEQLRPLSVYQTLYEAADTDPPGPPQEREW